MTTRDATATYDAMARIWSEVLGVERLDADDSFFELGGSSLAAIRIASLAHAELGGADEEELLFTLFDHPTLAGYVRTLEGLPQDAKSGVAAQ
jgi:hypothetical protein